MQKRLIKNLIVVISALLLIVPIFTVNISATDTTTVIITGEDLQSLLISGQWEATYMANGSTQDTMNMGSTIDNDAVVLISDVPTPVINFTEASMKFGSTIDYSNVVSFKIIFGGLANLTTPGTFYTTFHFNYADGYLLGSTRVDLPRNSSPGSNGAGTIPIYNNYTSAYNDAPLFVLSSSFEPMRLNEFIISTDTLDFGSTSQTNYIINNIKIAVKSIEITFENLSDTEIIKNQLEIANNYLSKIDESIQQGTQDIIENQDKNTLDIKESIDYFINGSEENQDKQEQLENDLEQAKEDLNKYQEQEENLQEEVTNNIDVETSTEDIDTVIDSEANQSVVESLNSFWGNTLIKFMASISSGLMLISFLLFGAH